MAEIIMNEAQREICEAMFSEKVQMVYLTSFSINIGPAECIIGIGITTPHDGKIKFTHRLHMPLIIAEQLREGLTQIIEIAKQQQEAAGSVKH